MKTIKKILFCVILIGFSHQAMAERVVLKTGESFDGTIIERNDQFITIQTGGAPVYLSLEHVAQIIEDRELARQYVAPAPQPIPKKPVAVINESQISDIPAASRQDGQYYYQQAKMDLQAGKLDESIKNLYTAASLGVTDSEGLKDKIEFAHKAVEQAQAKKNEIQEMVDKLDPNMQVFLLRLGIVVGVAILMVVLIGLYKKIAKGSDVSHFVKAYSSGNFFGAAENNFLVKAGPYKRISAFLFDVLIIVFPLLVLFAVFGPLIGSSAVLVYILLKDCFAGQSLGKRIMGLQVVDQNNQPAAPNSIALRNFYWIIVVVLPLFHPYLALGSMALIVWEYWGMLNDAQGQRFGDKISSTRVFDLNPRFEDWKYIVISVVIVIAMAGVYRLSVFGMTEFLSQIDLVNTDRNYQDSQGRFSFQIPAGFIVDSQYAQGNALVFNHQKDQQLFSVFVLDLSQDQAFSVDQLEMAAVSFWSAKFKIDEQKILANHSLRKTEIAGKPVAMYSYDSKAGKNISVCLINAQQFYEINFLFKDDIVDQFLIDEFVKHFRFLNKEKA